MGCFSGRLMSSASDQKLFCEICSVFNCSFDEFVGEKVVSPSYSSAILAPPPAGRFFTDRATREATANDLNLSKSKNYLFLLIALWPGLHLFTEVRVAGGCLLWSLHARACGRNGITRPLLFLSSNRCLCHPHPSHMGCSPPPPYNQSIFC